MVGEFKNSFFFFLVHVVWCFDKLRYGMEVGNFKDKIWLCQEIRIFYFFLSLVKQSQLKFEQKIMMSSADVNCKLRWFSVSLQPRRAKTTSEGKRCIRMPGPGYRIFSCSAGSWLTCSVAPFVMNPSILVSTIDIVISSVTPETETVGWDGKGKLLT